MELRRNGLLWTLGVASIWVLLMSHPSAGAIATYYDNLAGFNLAAGTPPIAIDFDGIAPGTDITGMTFAGATFALGNQPAPSASLIVVRGEDTFTPAGFSGAPTPGLNKLFPTSGQNVLSPGGIELAPGPNAALENDDLRLTFATPASAVGFDMLFQSRDYVSYTDVALYGPGDELLYQASVPVSSGGGGGAAGGYVFVGFVSSGNNIFSVVVNEQDGNSEYPDANIGYDTFRLFSPSDVPSAVPAPAAILLGTLGTGIVRWLRKRRSL